MTYNVFGGTLNPAQSNPTVDSIVQEPLTEDAGSAITDTDIYSRGPGKEQPVFPSLTLLVTGAASHGAGQEMDPRNPSLVPRTVAESCPQAVDLAHPSSQTGTRGAGQSTHFWGDVEPLMEQEQHFDHSTAAHTTHAGLTVHTATGYSPHELFYFFAPSCPLDAMLCVPTCDPSF